MESISTTFTVTGMTCEHCVAAVSTEVSKIKGVTDVSIDLPSGAVTVMATGPIDRAAISEAVDEAGYELAE